jgi:hypothetical protein
MTVVDSWKDGFVWLEVKACTHFLSIIIIIIIFFFFSFLGK